MYRFIMDFSISNGSRAPAEEQLQREARLASQLALLTNGRWCSQCHYQPLSQWGRTSTETLSCDRKALKNYLEILFPNIFFC